MANVLTSHGLSVNRVGMLLALVAGGCFGVAIVAAGTFGLVNDWGDSTAESSRTVAITAAAALLAGFILYRVTSRGVELGGKSAATRAAVIGTLALLAGVGLFWSGVWGPFGAAALVLGLSAGPQLEGRDRVLAFGGAILGAGGIGIGAAFSLFA